MPPLGGIHCSQPLLSISGRWDGRALPPEQNAQVVAVDGVHAGRDDDAHVAVVLLGVSGARAATPAAHGALGGDGPELPPVSQPSKVLPSKMRTQRGQGAPSTGGTAAAPESAPPPSRRTSRGVRLSGWRPLGARASGARSAAPPLPAGPRAARAAGAAEPPVPPEPPLPPGPGAAAPAPPVPPVPVRVSPLAAAAAEQGAAGEHRDHEFAHVLEVSRPSGNQLTAER